MLKIENLIENKNLILLFAKLLRPYSYPATSISFEDRIASFRVWKVNLDGYEICIQYTETELQNNLVKNIQVFAINLFDVPFHICFKVCCILLGNHENNVYFTFVKDGKKVTSWTRMETMNEEHLEIDKKAIKYGNYLGKKFAIINDFNL